MTDTSLRAARERFEKAVELLDRTFPLLKESNGGRYAIDRTALAWEIVWPAAVEFGREAALKEAAQLVYAAGGRSDGVKMSDLAEAILKL